MTEYSWNSEPPRSTSSRKAQGAQQPPSPPPKKEDNDVWFWIIAGFFLLIGAWPVSLIMLISKFSDKKGKRKRPTVTPPAQQSAQTQKAVERAAQTPVYSAKKTKLLQIVGIVLAVFGAFILGDLIGEISLYELSASTLEDLFFGSGFLFTGGGLILGSRSMKRRARRFGKYLAVARGQDAIDINDLAKAADVKEQKAEKDVELMVEKGLWGERAYVDAGRDMLFLSPEAAQRYFAAQQKPAEVPKEADEGYSGALRNIHRANDRISDPALSEKIDRIEDLAGKILRLIEQQPEKKPKAATFLNYYLPTTQKLLDSYADFEAAGVSGKNLSDAKTKIEATMDNIVTGFARQLDELYQAEALDIDSDIRVMENMLRRDGASAETDFGLGGGTAVQSDDAEFE